MLLNPFELKEAYNNGELQGKLEEIATKIDEDNNPVLMILDLNISR
jgi:hypothetical protein